MLVQAETIDLYRTQKGGRDDDFSDFNHEILLRSCNSKLAAWTDLWETGLTRGMHNSQNFIIPGF